VTPSQPLVSFLISAWNAEQHIGAAIESALAQTYSNFEIVFINDGSTDKTVQVVDTFQSRRIKTISLEKNRGIPAALNAGLNWCQGKYVARLDADDLCLPYRLEHQVAILEKHPTIGVLGGSAYALSERQGELPPLIVETNYDLGCQLLLGNQLKSSTVMIRRSVLEDFSVKYDESYANAQDYELWCRLSKFTRIANETTPVAVYRYHDAQQTSRHFERQLRLALRVQAQALGHARRTGSCSHRLIAAAWVTYLKHQLLLARVHVAQAPIPLVHHLAWSNLGSR